MRSFGFINPNSTTHCENPRCCHLTVTSIFRRSRWENLTLTHFGLLSLLFTSSEIRSATTVSIIFIPFYPKSSFLSEFWPKFTVTAHHIYYLYSIIAQSSGNKWDNTNGYLTAHALKFHWDLSVEAGGLSHLTKLPRGICILSFSIPT